MSPKLLRRALLLSLFAAAGCAAFTKPGEFFAHGHYWKQGAAASCDRIQWVVMKPEQRSCGKGTSATTSCAVGCYVFSPYSEEQAKRIDLWGISLYQHEVEWHIKKGLVHP